MKLIVTETIKLEFDIKKKDEQEVRDNPEAWYCARMSKPAKGCTSIDVTEREFEIEESEGVVNK